MELVVAIKSGGVFCNSFRDFQRTLIINMELVVVIKSGISSVTKSFRDFQRTLIPWTALASKALWSGIYLHIIIPVVRDISLTTGLYVKYTLVNPFDLRCHSDISLHISCCGYSNHKSWIFLIDYNNYYLANYIM